MTKFPDENAFGMLAPASAENAEMPESTVAPTIGGASALEIARADGEYLVRTNELRDALASEADPDGLQDKYEPLFRQAYDGSAALISDPQQRNLWTQSRTADLDGHVLAASDRALGLTREREIANAAAQLDAIRNSALQTTDQTRRAEFIQTANGLIAGLQQAGYIGEAEAKERQKAWAEDFALAGFAKLPAAERVRLLGEDTSAKGGLIDFVPEAKRESLLQAAQLDLRNKERATQSAAALQRHRVAERVRDDLASIVKNGRGVDDLSPKEVKAALGPEALRDWQEAREYFDAVRVNTQDLFALTDAQIDERLQSLAPEKDARSNPQKAAIFYKLEERADALRRMRLTDPAKSVENDAAVRTARDLQHQSNDPQALRNLYTARLAAQERAGIDEDLQSPITKDEALALIMPLRGIDPGQEHEGLAHLAESFNAQFGSDAGRTFDFALRALRNDAQVQLSAMQTVKAIRLRSQSPADDGANRHIPAKTEEMR